MGTDCARTCLALLPRNSCSVRTSATNGTGAPGAGASPARSRNSTSGGGPSAAQDQSMRSAATEYASSASVTPEHTSATPAGSVRTWSSTTLPCSRAKNTSTRVPSTPGVAAARFRCAGTCCCRVADPWSSSKSSSAPSSPSSDEKYAPPPRLSTTTVGKTTEQQKSSSATRRAPGSRESAPAPLRMRGATLGRAGRAAQKRRTTLNNTLARRSCSRIACVVQWVRQHVERQAARRRRCGLLRCTEKAAVLPQRLAAAACASNAVVARTREFRRTRRLR